MIDPITYKETVQGVLQRMSDDRHDAVVDRTLPDKIVVRCSCSVSWSHKATEKDEMILDIFRSHLAYDKREFRKPD